MFFAVPSDSIVVIFDGLPTGLVGSATPPGVQIRRASNNTVVSGRTEAGIIEAPVASGNYVVSLLAPAELGDYLVVFDWAAGVIAPSTSVVENLEVTASLPIVSSGIGAVADATKSHMGDTFDALVESAHYGPLYIMQKIAVVKSRVMTAPPITADESALDPLVIDYLGKLVALELMPAAIDYWARQAQTESTGSDPVETISYPDRLKALQQIQEALLRQTRRDEILVAPLFESPRSREYALVGPVIDEYEDDTVMGDVRDFPSFQDFPYSRDRATS